MDKMCLMWGNFQPAFGVLSKKLRFYLRYIKIWNLGTKNPLKLKQNGLTNFKHRIYEPRTIIDISV